MWRWIPAFFFLTSTVLAGETFSLDQVSDRLPSHGFQDRIEFWRAIFTEYGEKEVLIHDMDDLRLIYTVVRFEKGTDNDAGEWRRQQRLLGEKQRQLEEMLDDIRIHGPDSDRLSDGHLRVVQLLRSNGYTPSNDVISRLKSNIRNQRGIKERFRESLVRSGRYLDAIERIFERNGLPKELALLPHVESSFNYSAYSKRGAAGIWQFMPATGRRYLKINRNIDERLDPLGASEAAARLLRQNYEVLGNWPLSITAFNYGRNGMLRALRQHGPDLLDIIEHHKSRIWGFASKNFYAEFLTALEVARNYRKYFGPLELEHPLEFETVHLQRPCSVRQLTHTAKLEESILREYNPHIRTSIWKQSGVLPAGLELRIPREQRQLVLAALQTSPPAAGPARVAADGSIRYRVRPGDNRISNPHRIYPGQLLLVSAAKERPDRYQVRLGDTLIAIAKRFGISVRDLQRTNDLDNPNRIYLGQLLLIP